ncbi:MAG: PAS domain S-box protein [Deltaproteobacteria bacterium]|nr:PAS domain S-box protein [Deltaproteobacteria bacterium]
MTRDNDKTLEQLTDELTELRKQVSRLESLSRHQKEEQRLWNSDEQYRTLLQNAQEPVLIVQDKQIALANPPTAHLLGYSCEALSTLPAIELFWPEDRKAISDRAKKALKGDILSPTMAVRVMNKAGQPKWVQMTSMIITYEEKVSFLSFLSDVTSEQNAKQEIRKLSSIVEAISDGVMVTDLHRRITYVNQELTKQVGYGKDELIGKTPDLFLSEEDRHTFADHVQEVISGKQSRKSKEYVAKHKNGKEIPFSIKFSILKDPDRKANEIIAVSREISEKKASEEALKASQQRLSQIIDLLPDATMVIDLKGKVIAWNQAIETMTGIKAENMVGKGNHEYALPFYGKRRPILIDLVFKWDKEIEKKYEYVKREGDSLVSETYDPLVKPGGYLWNKASLLCDRKGEAIGAIESIRDITDRKVSEEALRESEEKYRSILENIEEGYFEVDIAGNLTFFNDSLCKILGYSKHELMGMNSRQYTDEQNAKELYEAFHSVYTTGTPDKVFNWNIIRKDGSKRYVESSVTLRKDSEGLPIGFQGIVRDVSERRQAEEEKARLKAQLQHAQKMEAIGTLAGGIAHDFNNLLMAIQGRTSIILVHKDSSDPDFEHLKGIEGHVESAVELTRQLLGFARGGKYEVRPTDLNELIKRENRMFGRTKKEITIRGKYEKDLWSVEVDRGQIEQVLLNLYVNAGQAMPGGGGLYLETENVILDKNYVKPFSIEPGRYVKISISDTGVGMDKAIQERIFEPFFTTKEMGRGTGLGLASVYGIIKNHGGFIDVFSEKGHGTTFNIFLPASEKEAVEEKKPAGHTFMGTETVLFVDDEDMIIEVVEALLERLGYNVLIAKSGKEAIETYEKNQEQIDIVVLDMIMPDMSGGDTYDRLKDIDPKVKVLLFSGYSIDGQASEIMERGCNGFLQKPFKMKELSQKLREILDRR